MWFSTIFTEKKQDDHVPRNDVLGKVVTTSTEPNGESPDVDDAEYDTAGDPIRIFHNHECSPDKSKMMWSMVRNLIKNNTALRLIDDRPDRMVVDCPGTDACLVFTEVSDEIHMYAHLVGYSIIRKYNKFQYDWVDELYIQLGLIVTKKFMNDAESAEVKEEE